MNKNLKMSAEIEFAFTQGIAENADLSFDFGPLEFLLDQKCIPIEFDQNDYTCDIVGNTATIKLEAGYAANSYKDSSRGDLDRYNKEPGLPSDDLTSKSMSKVTQINVFDVWPRIDDEDMDADEFKMMILKITFSDNFGSHAIGRDPIAAFNTAFNQS